MSERVKGRRGEEGRTPEGCALDAGLGGSSLGARRAGGARAAALPGSRALVLLLPLLLFTGCSAVDPYAGMDGEGLYQAGLDAFESEEWADAIAAFGRHLREAPGHPLNADARVYTARAYGERGEHITAAAEYELFLGVYPSHGLAPEASLGICRSYAALSPIPPRDQRYTRQALEACFETVQQFRGLTVAVEAEATALRMLEKLAQSDYEEGEFYRQRGCLPCAIPIFEGVVTEYPETSWAPRAMLAKVRAYRALGWMEEVEEETDRLLANFPNSDAAEEVRRDRGTEAPTSGG